MRRAADVCWWLGTVLALVGVPLLVFPGLSLTVGAGLGAWLPRWLIFGADDPVDVPKNMLLYLAAPCLLLGLAGRPVRRLDRSQQRAAWWMAGFLGWTLLSVIRSALPGWGWPAWWVLASLVVVMIVWCIAATAAEFQTMTLMLCASGGVMAVYALAQRAGWDPLSWAHPELTLAEWIGRPISTTGNPNFLGHFEAAVLPLAWQELTRAPGRGRRVWLGVSIGALLGSLALTQTRASVMALLVGMVVWLVMVRGRAEVAALGAVLLAACVATAFVVVLQRPVDPQEGSAGTRLYLWKVAERITARQPVFGCGLALFPYAALPHRDLEPERLRQRARLAEDPHNILLSYSASSGVPALLMLVGLLVLTGGRVRGGGTPDTRPGAAASLAAFWVNLMFTYPTAPASVAGCLATALLWSNPDAEARPAPRGWMVLGGALLLAALSVGGPTLQAEFAAKLAQEQAHDGLWQAALETLRGRPTSVLLPVQVHLQDDEAQLVAVGFAQTRLTAAALGALQAYQQESALNPLDPYPVMEAGRLAVELAAVDPSYRTMAIGLEDRAVGMDPYNPNFRRLRGMLHLRFKEPDKARDDFNASLSIAPAADAYGGLAEALHQLHDDPGARDNVRRALSLDRNNPAAQELARNLGL